MAFFSINLVPLGVNEVAETMVSMPDVIYTGDSTFVSRRNIYLLNDVHLFKRQFLLLSENGTAVNLIGAKSERRNYLPKLSLIDKMRLKTADIIANDKFNFVLFPHNPHKNNYWHCLMDNISQLAVILNFNKNINLIAPDNCSPLIMNYISFLQSLFSFSVTLVKDKPLKIQGKVLFTEPSVLNGFEHNKIMANKFRALATKEIQKNGGKLEKTHFKFGTIPHAFTVNFGNKKSKTIKSSSGPWSTPFRRTSLNALQSLVPNGIRESSKKRKIILAKRTEGRERNPLNQGEIETFLTREYGVNLVDFSKLNFEEQIILARNCSVLIGVNGAEFANMIFMKPDSHIIEIVPPWFSLPVTQIIETPSKALGFKYSRIIGTPSSNSSYNVPLAEFYALLTK